MGDCVEGGTTPDCADLNLNVNEPDLSATIWGKTPALRHKTIDDNPNIWECPKSGLKCKDNDGKLFEGILSKIASKADR